ncbi:hypothetical protein MCEMSEM23_00197 [Rhabdaerophilaceae bacterium]
MRWYFVGLVLAVSLGPSFAQDRRAACPDDAEKAGYSLWGAGSIQSGQTKRGTHACGKRIECIGARPGDRKRACRWL